MTSSTNTSHPSFSPSTTYRRPSYANVAAGLDPARFNTLAAFNTLNRGQTSIPSQPQQQASRQRSRSSLRSMEIDGQSGNVGWKRPTSSWSNEVGRLDGRMGCPLHDEHPPFFTPSYLRQSRHVQRLHKAWDEHVSELQESAHLNPPRQPSLSTSSSNVNLSKMHTQHIHRGPVQDVIERIPPPTEEDKSRPLPSRWDDEDRMGGLEVLADGSEVRFNGVTKNSDEAASVRSDHPMPRDVGLYYFEVTVLSRGKDGLIGIGFSGKKVSLNRLPGWETNSWAYHGDDGYSFACTASGKAYGPRFSAQDVIGCGVNFMTGRAFFTKNGVYLGDAFTGISEDKILYPSVGMKKPGEHLRVNFGRYPFVFDIDGMMEKDRREVMAEFLRPDVWNGVRALHPPDDENALIHNLIGQYLAHEGYVETAKAFAQDVNDQQQSLSSEKRPLQLPSSDDDIHAFNRQKIRKSILDGDIDKALKFTNSFYPHVLEEERNRDIHFRLRCRKFIEMMRRYTELSATTTSPTVLSKSVESLESNGHVEEADDMTDGQEPPDTQMELDDQLHREASKGLEPPSTDDVDMDASQELPSKASFMKQTDLLNQALAYGRELQFTFGGDPRPQIKKQLSDIFAIMAYTNPTESVVGQLLDPHGRVQIAEEINGAILVSLGKPPSAALERLCAQTEAMLDGTAAKTGGSAAWVNVRAHFLQP